MGKLDPDDPQPPYRQIANRLRGSISSGALEPGQQLPALAALASEYDVSIGTIKHALGVLREEGLVVTRQGKGSFVRTRRDGSQERVGDEIEGLRVELAELRDRLEALEQRLAE